MRTYFAAFLFLLTSLLVLNAAEDKEYKLQKDDVIRMIVFQEPDLTTESKIGKSGYVSFPLIGNVKVSGKGLKEAEDEIKALYEKDYLVNAQVNLSILGFAEKWVIVGGDVRSPGTVPFPEEGALDLRGAVAQAGGVLESANTDGIVVRSKSGAISYHSLKGSGSRVMKHGDTITVPRQTMQKMTLTVSGQVNRPGVVEYPKEGKMDIMTALAQAGGFSRIAYKKAVTVHRNKRQMLVDIKAIEDGRAPMFLLEPGDLVVVRESRF
ncbi:polysaccharide biosynthesis/export family protein [Rubritalea spongiae]|uniref:Polysaccharide biosynthesis/export family protein n=2 Tax=Rubritalea spongiae TaxID=430797 RepID=A0ABW5E1H4_9BACT